MIRREHPIQVTIHHWLEWVLAPCIVFSIKNELFFKPGMTDRQRIAVVNRAKAAGMRKGFYDLGVLLDGGKTFFVECKDPEDGVLAETQRLLHFDADALGHRGCVADCVENVRWSLNHHRIATREAPGQPMWPWNGRVAKLRPKLPADALPF